MLGQEELGKNLGGIRHARLSLREAADSIELPQGGPPPPPHLCARILGDCHALKACMCRTAVLKAHGEMKVHILATIWPDFGFLGIVSVKQPFRRHETKNARKFRKIDPRTVQNRGPEPPKSRPGGSKIESEALQDAIFQDI